MGKTCTELFAGIDCTILGNADDEVNGIAYRSDRVQPGDAFFCVVGMTTDGHSFAQDAIDRGAKVLVVERKVYLADATDVTEIVVKDTRKAMAAAAANFYDHPSKDLALVGITGTNGKTTTTALAAHLLRQAGLAAAAVGNIGDTCIQAVAAGKTEVYVAEVSSYQLASTRDFAPNVALVLNITPDHLAWHGSHEAYAAAKWKVLANLGSVPGAVAVLAACDDAVRARIREAREAGGFPFAYVPVGTAAGVGGDMRDACGSDNAAFRGAAGRLTVALRGEVSELIYVDDLQIKGAHNQANALAAASAALALDVPASIVAEGLLSFAPLEHRVEPAGEVAGVACYNDSKATNVDATLVALTAFLPTRPIVLLGGRDKGTDLAPLVAACEEHAKAAVCFGEARERFLAAFEGSGVRTLSAPGMEAALDAALSIAEPGDVVVLSPACASFDEFSCFEERGDVFKALVAERAARAAGARP